MHLTPSINTPTPIPEAISCWQLGAQLTGGRFYNLFHAVPKTGRAESQHGYVLKIVNPHLEGDDVSRAIDRLGREAMATEQLVHPNVIRLLDAELDHAPFFLVQPWIEGKTLDRLFSRAPHLPLTRMLWVLRQIAEGVRAGHEKGRVYLGLDPSHVLLGRTGRVTLIGWSQSHGFEERVWLPMDRLQTARYLAPECFANDYRATPASDVYSLGVLIYHALTRQAPFDGPTVDAIKQAHQDSIAEDLMFAQTNTPPRLSELVKQMLRKNPQQRPSFNRVLDQLISIEIEHLSDNRLIRL
ncbi:MAG: serine/threonine-protein kinase [Planctomycetota bacterium]